MEKVETLPSYKLTTHWGLASGESHIPLGEVSPPLISQTTGLIYKMELSEQGVKYALEVIDDVHARSEMLDCSGLMTLAYKISRLNINKANESAWIISLTF